MYQPLGSSDEVTTEVLSTLPYVCYRLCEFDIVYSHIGHRGNPFFLGERHGRAGEDGAVGKIIPSSL